MNQSLKKEYQPKDVVLQDVINKYQEKEIVVDIIDDNVPKQVLFYNDDVHKKLNKYLHNRVLKLIVLNGETVVVKVDGKNKTDEK